MFLKSENVENEKICNVVEKDFRYAKVLDSFGINFYKHPNLTINQICNIRGIDTSSLLGYRLSLDESFELDIDTLKTSPLNLVIEYLKHNHSYFIKNKLPFIKNLISNLDLEEKAYPFFKDLKFIFPLFCEDFVEHILEEEKFIFTHIKSLSSVRVKSSDHAKLFFALKNTSLKEIADEHLNEDSEMSGIRGLTKNYSIENIENLHLKVIFQELKDFDDELETHSDIENKILFPRAMDLEKTISEKIRNISFLN